jgi:xanthine dehydrogenase YagS FAD-binding subunit
MRTFAYEPAATLEDAIAAATQTGTMVIAGGTELINWMKEGIVTPRRLVDLNGLPGLAGIEIDELGLTIGALARMSEVAAHEGVRRDYPVIAQALLKSASAQIRNMASMGGNLMQRTRCPYFRAEVELPCNKRRPGSGCSAADGEDRAAAVFGWSEHCVATHPSDVAVALAALDATVCLEGPGTWRTIALVDLHCLPEASPERDTELRSGEIITAICVPASAVAARSHYVKVRERASYEFALVSAAAALEVDGDLIREARVALGGVAAKPWRLFKAERELAGIRLSDDPALRRALEQDFAEARPRRHNGFKVELGLRAALRALQAAGATP